MSSNLPPAPDPEVEERSGTAEGVAFSKSLERGLMILSAFSQGNPVLGIADLARAVNLNRSTTYRYVATLAKLGYVEQDPDTRKYSLGQRVVDWGLTALSSMEMTRVAAGYLQSLADETGFPVSMAILDGTDIVYVDRRKSRRPAGLGVELDLHVGSRIPAYCTAMGKVLLASLDRAALRLLLERMNLSRRGPNTITAREQLVAALARVRETGTGIDNEEFVPGIRSIAAPVRDRSGTVVAAINVAVHVTAWSAPMTAVVGRFEAPLARTAAEISARLGYRPQSLFSRPLFEEMKHYVAASPGSPYIRPTRRVKGQPVFLEPTRWQDKLFIGGSWQSGSSGIAAVTEPATGAVLGQVGVASPADVDRAAAAAAAAQRSWAATPHPQRAAIMRRAAQLWAEHAEEISWWNIREVGAVPGMAGFAVHVAEQECYEAAALPSRPYGELLPSEEPRLSMASRIPAGVVAVISPFNVPIILGIRSVAPALALGNAVILKPDPRTAVTGGVAIARIFEEAGLPPGVLQMLPGAADVGQALVTHPLVRVISFTGSTEAGRAVGELAGRHLKRAHLELGGNSALIVMDDADVKDAVGLAAWGSFFHQGQICMTTGRHLVHQRVYDEFVEQLGVRAAALPVGNPATDPVALGPLIDAGQRDKVHNLVTVSLKQGARLQSGGTFEGLFYAPTVLADVRPGVAAFEEEIFGPVAPVVPFASAEEAAELAAATPYGLSLGIVTRDAMKGLALAQQIPTGIVHINDQTVNDEANAPFGGLGASGTGSRFGGAAANIEAFTESRWITMRGQAPVYPF